MWWKFWRAVRRGEHKVSPVTKLTAFAAVIYTIVPVDLIPEIVFGPLGFVDDLGMWGVVVMLATREKNAWEAARHARATVVDA